MEDRIKQLECEVDSTRGKIRHYTKKIRKLASPDPEEKNKISVIQARFESLQKQNQYFEFCYRITIIIVGVLTMGATMVAAIIPFLKKY